MKRSVAVLVDGGHLRALARRADKKYDPSLIDTVARSCADGDEEIFRILYYDCAPYAGSAKLPVSGQTYNFEGSDSWLRALARKDRFAVRRGVLKFRGWKPKRVPVAADSLSDEDFKADFEQKGVDMRIGLDMASLADQRIVDRIVLITGDTDCAPAMKHVRKAGLQVVLVKFRESHDVPELEWHADFVRLIDWP